MVVEDDKVAVKDEPINEILQDSDEEKEQPSDTEEETSVEESTSDDSEQEASDEAETKFTQEEVDALVQQAERKYQSNKDKELKALYEERDNLRKKTLELEGTKLQEANNFLFAQEEEDAGEDRAKKAKNYREMIIQAHNQVNTLANDLGMYRDEKGNPRSKYEDDLKEREVKIDARDFGYKYFPGADEAVSKQREGFIAQLMESGLSGRELATEARALSAEMKSRKQSVNKNKPARVPKESKGGKLTFEQIRKMSPLEKERRNDEILKFFEENS